MACMRKLIVSKFLTLDGYYESVSKTFDRTPSAVPRSGASSRSSSASRRSTSSPTPSPRKIWRRGRTPPGSSAARTSTRRLPRSAPGHPRCGRSQETEVGRDAGVDRRPPVVFRDLYCSTTGGRGPSPASGLTEIPGWRQRRPRLLPGRVQDRMHAPGRPEEVPGEVEPMYRGVPGLRR